jgi:hypothetical protein
MSRIRRINVSQIEGNNSNDDNNSEIRPFGEVGFYTNEDGQTDKLELLMFDGVRTHIKSKILGPGVFYGSNADSSDGAGLDTIKLIPDAALYRNDSNYGNDQYLILDPTAPNHIHLRAGGTIDNSNAALILGGENSNVEVQAGENPPVYVRSNNNTWMFDVDGSLLFPGNLVLPDADFVGIPGEVPPAEPAILFPVPGFDGGKIQITSSGLEVSAETYTWTFGVVDGSLTFPDATIQTTAWTGNVDWNNVINTPTISSTGNITFSNNEIQGNPLGTVGTIITVSQNRVSGTSQNSNVFELTKSADTDQVQVGWVIRGSSGSGTAQTITQVFDGGSYWQFFVASGIQTEFPITIESSDYQLGSNPELILTVDPVSADPKSWIFNVDGSLTFPDNTSQSTAYASGIGQVIMIDTHRTDDYVETGSADKPFKTFAAAIAAAEDAGIVSCRFVLMGCTVTENVDFTGTNFTLLTIATTSRAVISGNVTINIPTLSQLVVRGIEFGSTFTITGNGTANQLNSTSFYHTTFSGAVNITAINSLAFFESSFFNTVNFTNINYTYVNGAQFTNNLTFTVDDSGATPIPSNGIAPCIVIGFSFIANNVYMTKVGSGSGFLVFQPHMSRMGLGAGTYTIPAGWTFTPHSTVLRGTWVNNGTAQLRNSSHDNAIGGTAPSYVGTIGAATVKVGTAISFTNGTSQTTAWAGIPGPYADDAAAASAGVAVGYPYHKTGTSGQVFVRLS